MEVMATFDMVRKNLLAKRDDALYWQRHYEVEYTQSKSDYSRRNAMYYEGLRRGYEVAIDELYALKAS